MLRHYSEETSISSWQGFTQFQARFDATRNWVFRGQAKWDWPLKTSIERVAGDYALRFDDLPMIELGLVREFQRHYHHFSADHPKYDDYVEWLSIMQHHGAPTRLLDVSYSIFVALLFAVIDSAVGSESAIWCVDSDWLHEKYMNTTTTDYVGLLKTDLAAHYLEINKTVLNDRIPFLYCANPFRLNQRLTVQQGAFLLPLDISRPFMENLEQTATEMSETAKIMKVKLILHANFLNEILANLRRMNVTKAALFPGLDGFAGYLKMLTKFPNAIYAKSDRFI